MEKEKELLQKVLRNLPPELSEVRFHVRQALQKLEKYQEKKEKKTKTQHQKWQEKLHDNIKNPYTTQETLDAINQMIDEERKKLDDILQKNKAQPKDETLNG